MGKFIGCLFFAVVLLVVIFVSAGVKVFDGFSNRRDVEMVAGVAAGSGATTWSAFGGGRPEHPDAFTGVKSTSGSLAFNKNGQVHVDAVDGKSIVSCETKFQGKTISAKRGKGHVECWLTVTPDGDVVPM
ncbi:hypothetical protein [Arthrobacter sp. C9C5]|uniref:hypothetical protein n=1 Tax=Arthrobacter sp. C9C5 TaxID=2735267 RepID=UPI001C309A05|nr:hypothetical protein [Arthrobacter sp. C9C5]